MIARRLLFGRSGELAALGFFLLVAGATTGFAQTDPFTVVDTGQVKCYDATAEITCPPAGQPYYGQDSQHPGYAPSFTMSADGLTVYDENTGLTWQKIPDTNGDGTLNSSDKVTWAQAQARPAALNAMSYGGFTDWRLPTIKELYSLIDFRGTDPSGATGNDTSGLTPFIDRTTFDFVYGDTSVGERVIDAQYWSGTGYVATTMGGFATQFGVNFADGRIKGYPRDTGPGGTPFKEFLRCLRGNPDYGKNQFVDNGDGTVTDGATGLMWAKDDSGTAMDWQDALAWVQAKNASNYLGHADWRMPNAKEMQSIVDYTRSPDTTNSAAIDPVFGVASITNEGGALDYPWFWTGTTHASSDGTGAAGIYVCFGRAVGWMKATQSATCYSFTDVHGAGAQRSDPKSGSPTSYYLGPACSGGSAYGRGPQGDAIRIANYVRPVRDADGASGSLSADFTYTPTAPTDATPVTFTATASGGTTPYTYTWDLGGSAASGQSVTGTLSAGSHTVSLTVLDSAGSTGVATHAVTVAPSVTIDGVTAAPNPFRLNIAGTNFQSGCAVTIGGAAAPKVAWKSAGMVVAKGTGLKAMVPAGVSVQIVVVNPDGTQSEPYSFMR